MQARDCPLTTEQQEELRAGKHKQGPEKINKYDDKLC